MVEGCSSVDGCTHGVGGHCSHSYLHFGMWMVGIHHIGLVLQLVHKSVVSELMKEVEVGLNGCHYTTQTLQNASHDQCFVLFVLCPVDGSSP